MEIDVGVAWEDEANLESRRLTLEGAKRMKPLQPSDSVAAACVRVELLLDEKAARAAPATTAPAAVDAAMSDAAAADAAREEAELDAVMRMAEAAAAEAKGEGRKGSELPAPTGSHRPAAPQNPAPCALDAAMIRHHVIGLLHSSSEPTSLTLKQIRLRLTETLGSDLVSWKAEIKDAVQAFLNASA